MATLTELDVKLEDPVFVKPADDELSVRKAADTSAFFLSNIEQMLAFTVETVFFYAANPDNPSDTVADTLKTALSNLLVHYDFLAGRVRLNEELMRMEIDRNYAGAQFGEASCDLTLAELGDVNSDATQCNPLFRKFAPQPHNAATIADIPLLMIQVTTLKCGGHVIGFGMSHQCWDGHGIAAFLFNLMSFAQGGPLLFEPKPDRGMLKARDPPTPIFDHPEYLLRDDLPPNTGGSFTTAEVAKSEFVELGASTELVTKIFPFSAEDLAILKKRALEGGVVKKVSIFEALSAHVWQARTKATDAEPTQLAQLLYAVDIRDRLDPPIPEGFCGNAIYSACARATFEEIRNGPLSFCVQQIQQANARVTNEYIRSGIDWWEVHRGIPAVSSGIFITSWQEMPLYLIDFGWGLPVFAGPAVTALAEFVVFLPTPKQDGGLNVFLALQPDVMAKFEEYAKVSADTSSKVVAPHPHFPLRAML